MDLSFVDQLWAFLNQPFIAGSFVIVGVFLTRWWQVRDRDGESVRVKDCKRFKARIGGEVDTLDDSVQLIKRCLVFLVSRNGGNPHDFGLMQ